MGHHKWAGYKDDVMQLAIAAGKVFENFQPLRAALRLSDKARVHRPPAFGQSAVGHVALPNVLPRR